MNGPQLRLHGSALRANVEAVRSRIAPSALMMVLKDDAYRHGLEWSVRTALEADVAWFGSYDVAGALRVRDVAGDRVRIFAWATSTDAEIDAALGAGVDLGVGTEEYLRRVLDRAGALGVRARVHLKIDTGLHRNGVLPEDWADAVGLLRAAESRGAAQFVGVWSHISEASDDDDDEAQQVFLRAVSETGEAPELLHLTASAASWWRPELRGTLSRIGAFCYGIRSADGPELDGLRPVAELVAPVIDVLDGDAVVAVGSFHGVPSTLAGAVVGTPAGAREILRIDAQTSLIAGWPGARIGDDVTVFGPGGRGELGATDLAERIDTVGEEILTRLSTSISRVVVD